MSQNNFQKLIEENELFLEPVHQELIRKRVHSSISLFRMVGQIVDLFVPNFFLTFSDILDGNKPICPDRFPNLPTFKK